jgi:ribosomal protein S18 acetylase RimI-like enzyme
MLRRCTTTLTKFNGFRVRNISSEDIDGIVRLYQRAFSEPPWNEIWGRKAVIEDLKFAMCRVGVVALLADVEQTDQIAGFTWGYKLPVSKFPFLKEYWSANMQMVWYIDEVAVDVAYRRKGVGKLLTKSLEVEVALLGAKSICLRTDISNPASMGLYKNLGYLQLLNENRKPMMDPRFQSRTYLGKKVD